MGIRSEGGQAFHEAAAWAIENAHWHDGLEGAAAELVRHDPFVFAWGGGQGQWSFADADIPAIVAEAEKIMADTQARQDAFQHVVDGYRQG